MQNPIDTPNRQWALPATISASTARATAISKRPAATALTTVNCLPHCRHRQVFIRDVSFAIPKMSLFTTTLTEDKILLTVTLTNAALLAIVLLIAIRRDSIAAATTSFAIVLCVLLVILFLFVHDSVYTAAEPAVLENDDVELDNDLPRPQL